jgi:hypothetical protein
MATEVTHTCNARDQGHRCGGHGARWFRVALPAPADDLLHGYETWLCEFHADRMQARGAAVVPQALAWTA